MYLFWKTSEKGRLNISRDGLRNFANHRLPDGYKCRDISLDADESEIMAVVTLPQTRNSIEMAMVEENLKEGFTSLGFRSKFAWAEVSRDEHSCLSMSWGKNPWIWGGIVATIAAMYLLGPVGILWVLIFGAAGYLISRFCLVPDKSKFIKDLKERFWR